jgi:ribulose-5-phosphate 4-epimerase/fuculose-1-phosphate aldolase
MDGQGSGISGHLTARLPGARTFWSIPYGYGFEEATANELIESDFDLRTVTGTLRCNPKLNIHTEIYEARPEVCCILHTHSEASLALATTARWWWAGRFQMPQSPRMSRIPLISNQGYLTDGKRFGSAA